MNYSGMLSERKGKPVFSVVEGSEKFRSFCLRLEKLCLAGNYIFFVHQRRVLPAIVSLELSLADKDSRMSQVICSRFL